MNKKGALFHWAVFGMLVATGIFFILTYDLDASSQVKGQWQFDYLLSSYLEGENNLFMRENMIKQIARDALVDLAAERDLYDPDLFCGFFNGQPLFDHQQLWHKDDKDKCSLETGEKVLQALDKKFTEELPAEMLPTLELKGREVIGTMPPIEVAAKMGRYKLDSKFRISLGYVFE